MKNANSIIAVSEGLKKTIIEKNNDVKVDVIYNGVDLNKFSIKQSLKTGVRPMKFIYVGNLIHSKGIFDLLKAFEILQKRGIDCELTFCGEGKEKTNIIEYCSRNSIKHVTIYGAINNDDLPSILSKHDVLVLPSHREGLGVVLIEALAMGKLVIGSNVGG
ncbi:glycosyltransferase family 4 protein, partial [Vibrio parahaemolyticus]|nr:glycosyltransferase family 4 protein [Vibrio parahaemolyticus]